MILDEKIEKNKMLIAGIAVFGLIFGFVFWNFYLSPQKEIKREQKKELTSDQSSKININFNVLDGDYLKSLESMGKIPEFQGQIGRDNPFIQ